ncbi:hypothetical protein K3495_g8797 [Podosphaera aphanis]|nr:hypothetical protein K3495_g8797 [Podosphaera aphanis]
MLNIKIIELINHDSNRSEVDSRIRRFIPEMAQCFTGETQPSKRPWPCVPQRSWHPTTSRTSHATAANNQSEEAMNKHQADLEEWTLGKIEAKNIIIDRIVPTMCPNHYDNMTAKELYDTIANTRQETASAPYTISLDNFLDVKMTTTANVYIDQFQSALQNVNNAADTLSTTDDAEFHIGKELAAVTFVKGTKHIPWLKRGEQLERSSPTENIHQLNS